MIDDAADSGSAATRRASAAASNASLAARNASAAARDAIMTPEIQAHMLGMHHLAQELSGESPLANNAPNQTGPALTGSPGSSAATAAALLTAGHNGTEHLSALATTRATALSEAVAARLATVKDPEIPVLTIADLGILRGFEVLDHDDNLRVIVTITPTYSGCPAMDAITADVQAALADFADAASVEVRTVLSPAWTTDWMTQDGKRKLAEFGIAPPGPRPTSGPIPVTLGVTCPQCGSLATRELARFGSTSCKAQYLCTRCQEPFDHFKAH